MHEGERLGRTRGERVRVIIIREILLLLLNIDYSRYVMCVKVMVLKCDNNVSSSRRI